MSNNILDAGIPVLTEIIPGNVVAEAPLVAEVVAEAVDPAVADPFVELPVVVALSDKARWEQLEQDLQERVLAQLIGRVDLVLEQRVRDCLADVLQSSVERLASELREGLRLSIKDAVNRALTQEIADAQRTIR